MKWRWLAVVAMSGLLAGCTTSPCAPPGWLSRDPPTQCLYRLQVTGIEPEKYFVTGKIVPPEERQKQLTGKDMTKEEDTYTFRILDLEKLKLGKEIEKGGTYYFIRNGNSPYLEHFPIKPEVEE